ncbi:hypothetical protein BC829DRAFT_407803 [Chytridium lagenaria]|nr:hypothetical protein BC829DRAFT_407803 [Chytridium lagenaria]
MTVKITPKGDVVWTSGGTLMWWCHSIFGIYILINIAFHYYMVVVMPWQSSFEKYLYILVLCLSFSISNGLSAFAWWTAALIFRGKKVRYLRNLAESRGERYINEYDLGFWRNMTFFLNVSDKYPWWLVFIPIPVPPACDGTWFPKVSIPPKSEESGDLVVETQIDK